MVNGKRQWPQTLDLFFVVIYNRGSSCNDDVLYDV